MPLGDGVNANDVANLGHFPYVAAPHAGLREREGDELGTQRLGARCGGPSALITGPMTATASSSQPPSSIGAAVGALFGGVLRETAQPRLGRARPGRAAGRGLQGRLHAERLTAALVAGAPVEARRERRRTSTPGSLLGLAYQQRARETGDPTYYTKSEGALERALALDPKDSLAYSGLGSLALSRHRFREALALGEQAHALAPTIARNYGVIGDALVELGRYPRGVRDVRPDEQAPPEPLLLRARLLRPRAPSATPAGAIKAMKLAVDAATGAKEPTAWTHVQLGKLYFNHGRYGAAAREYRLATPDLPRLRLRPRRARAGRGARSGRYATAIALERQAVDAIPLPQYVARARRPLPRHRPARCSRSGSTR